MAEATPYERRFMAWVRTQPCLAASAGRCRGGVQAHHAGEHGLGVKAPHMTCIPLCDGHHDAYHDGGHPFSGASKELRRMWAALAVMTTWWRWDRAEAGHDRYL